MPPARTQQEQESGSYIYIYIYWWIRDPSLRPNRSSQAPLAQPRVITRAHATDHRACTARSRAAQSRASNRSSHAVGPTARSRLSNLFWKMAEHYRKMTDKISRMVEKWLSTVANKWLSSVYKKILTRSQSDRVTVVKIIKWLSTVAIEKMVEHCSKKDWV
jgi:hypothetical protein